VYLTADIASEDLALVTDAIGGMRTLIVTTPTVAHLHGKQIFSALRQQGEDVSLLVLNCTERNKTMEQVERVCAEALRLGLDRRAVLLAMGGGVVTDIVTISASWIRRGITTIRIPTTLIGQVDAAVGIKGAVNFQGRKSYLGCFYAPASVFIDPSRLSTLPDQHVRDGLAEIIKIALVRDSHLFDLVERYSGPVRESRFAQPDDVGREIIWRSVLRMLEELESNIFEDQTYMRLVDMGHTFSPALEAATGFTLSHGEAVAIDIALTCAVAACLGSMTAHDRDRVIAAIQEVGLPLNHAALTPDLCRRALGEATRHRGGALNLPLPAAIGEATFLRKLADLPASVLSESLQWLQARSVAGSAGRATPAVSSAVHAGA
jgi:2-epi-5-epi-valiolone synthase